MYKSIMYHGEVESLNKVLLLTLKNNIIHHIIKRDKSYEYVVANNNPCKVYYLICLLFDLLGF